VGLGGLGCFLFSSLPGPPPPPPPPPPPAPLEQAQQAFEQHVYERPKAQAQHVPVRPLELGRE
jgi:hypothetical protein